MERIQDIKNYSGLLSELPETLPFGDTFYATDKGELYKYNSSNKPVSEKDNGTGFAIYNDDQYTEASPLVILQGDENEVTLNINGATTIKSQLPFGVTDFYDSSTSKITPENILDYYEFSLYFKGKNTSNNGGGQYGIDIGGSFTKPIFQQSFRFPRGSNTEHPFKIDSQGFSGSTFVPNGGLIKLKSTTGISSLYDFNLHIFRKYKGK